MTDMIPAAKPIIGDDERAAVDRVLRSGMIAQGPEVAAFEQEFGAHLAGGRTCVAVNSGTAGPAPRPAGRRRRPRRRGHRPVVHLRGHRELGGAHRRHAGVRRHRARLLLPRPRRGRGRRHRAHRRHHAGAPVRPPGRHDRRSARSPRSTALKIFEDAAQAHGATWQGAQVGTFGTFAMFSLYPTKNMTSGEGGMVSCADDEIARMVRLLRNQGMEKRYENEVVGFNARMTDVHAAIGRVQLGKLDGWTADPPEQRRVPRPSTSQGVVVAAGRRGRHARLPPVHDPGHRRPRRLRQGARRRARRRHRRVLPDPEPPAAVVPSSPSTCPRPSAPPQEALSLPVHPSLSQGDLERVVDGRQRRREGRCLRWRTCGPACIGLGHDGPPPRPRAAVAGRRRPGRRGRPGRRPARRRRRPARCCATSQQIIDAGVDYCMVAVPTQFHEEIGLALAAAGVHALVEKPLAKDTAGSSEAGRGVRGRRAGRRGRAHRAVQPGAAEPARPARAGRARRASTRSSPAGRARSRPGSPTSAWSRTSAPTTST